MTYPHGPVSWPFEPYLAKMLMNMHMWRNVVWFNYQFILTQLRYAHITAINYDMKTYEQLIITLLFPVRSFNSYFYHSIISILRGILTFDTLNHFVDILRCTNYFFLSSFMESGILLIYYAMKNCTYWMLNLFTWIESSWVHYESKVIIFFLHLKLKLNCVNEPTIESLRTH